VGSLFFLSLRVDKLQALKYHKRVFSKCLFRKYSTILKSGNNFRRVNILWEALCHYIVAFMAMLYGDSPLKIVPPREYPLV